MLPWILCGKMLKVSISQLSPPYTQEAATHAVLEICIVECTGEKEVFHRHTYKDHRDFCIGQSCRHFDWTDSQLSQLNLLQVVQQSTYRRASKCLFTALFPIFCLHQYLLILLHLPLSLLSLSSPGQPQ